MLGYYYDYAMRQWIALFPYGKRPMTLLERVRYAISPIGDPPRRPWGVPAVR
jgi:hypothetical protein